MSIITKEWLRSQISAIKAVGITESNTLQAFEIALASLEAEPVGVIDQSNLDYLKSGSDADVWPASRTEMGDVLLYRSAPPAPVSVPDEATPENIEILASTFAPRGVTYQWDRDECNAAADSWNACRATMLQGADTELQRKAAIHDALCEKYNVEALADFVEWQRNHIAELEAAPPAPVGLGETAVMPDYPGYVMTQRECFDAGTKRAVPDGWVVVPAEPTYQMCKAMGLPWESPRFPDRYEAMLSAAPQQE